MPLFLRSRDVYCIYIYIHVEERWMDGKRDYTIGTRISLFMGWEQWAWLILPINEDASRLSLRWKCFFKLSFLPFCLNDARDSLQTLIAKRIVVYGDWTRRGQVHIRGSSYFNTGISIYFMCKTVMSLDSYLNHDINFTRNIFVFSIIVKKKKIFESFWFGVKSNNFKKYFDVKKLFFFSL